MKILIDTAELHKLDEKYDIHPLDSYAAYAEPLTIFLDADVRKHIHTHSGEYVLDVTQFDDFKMLDKDTDHDFVLHKELRKGLIKTNKLHLVYKLNEHSCESPAVIVNVVDIVDTFKLDNGFIIFETLDHITGIALDSLLEFRLEI